ncbi:hypothetical protein BGW36DRAFT_425941 [Talaromyces proteolyticus]|uniref:Uncharacterized protein n=1 Tax=Talaromyces proteolyticus TaxID=1131652 RepID=A0AAD4KXR8_9EURO|nr:uncharacterized protein BGW36DRAFT_425941 [Talaromyces proteolyticus]KAH8701147.1 hypothetical protein BGW36DRAFT_425941 [Talaromyces proteolyticus]
MTEPKNKAPTSDEDSSSADQKLNATSDLFLQSQDLQNCNWQQLMEMFSSALREHERIDHDLQEEATQLLKVFVTWSEVTVSRDEARSYKRFQTRMQYVQNTERELAEKKKHYGNVVKAFENALALLK